MILTHISESTKVIGYFSHTDENVFCDGDACIIAGSEELMKGYLRNLSGNDERDVIQKVRFGEVLEGLRLGGAYAFDEESYGRFFHLANRNKVKDVLTKEPVSGPAPAMHFVRIQMF